MVETRLWGRAVTCMLLALPPLGCGGSDNPSSPPAGPTPNPYTITISGSGVVAPKELMVPPGSRVMFVNNHSRRHEMASDPHPEHDDCPSLDQIGLLNPGQSRESGNLVTVRTCGFHDHGEPDNVNLRGSIVIR